MYIRELLGTEYLYAYTNSNEINLRTGLIGHLRCDFGKNGKEFWTSFFPYMNSFPAGFKESLNILVNRLCGKDDYSFSRSNQILRDRQAMEEFTNNRSNEVYLLPNSTKKYGLRVECRGFTYIINFYPQVGDYNAYIYCYKTEHLDEHLKKSSKGIRFVDSKYNDLFRIPDGGRIIITEPNGKFHSRDCRYLDDYHFETVIGGVFHICEFAEYMENNGNTVSPAEV